MKKFIKDFTEEERNKICKHHIRNNNGKCTDCPLHPLCKFNVFGALGHQNMDGNNGANPNYFVIEVDDEVLNQDKPLIKFYEKFKYQEKSYETN